jgi:pimeloyl-ACP methyl ester carboxylesterase
MTWGELPALLEPGHTVVAYSRRSFPPNDSLKSPTSLRDHADDLAHICEQLDQPVVLVGWSVGGVISLDLAIHRPQLVERIVLIEAPLHAKKRPTPSLLRGVVGAQLVGRNDAVRGARHFLDWALGRSDGRPSDLTRLDEDRVAAAGPAIIRELGFGTGENEVAARELAQLARPCDWLVGSASIPMFDRCGTRAAAKNPLITLHHIDGSGHAMALDNPGAVADAVDAPAPKL